MKIAEYNLTNKADCMAVFDSNLPKYFADYERLQFEKFLSDEATHGPYYVVLLDDAIVGCGGYYLSGTQAHLSWGMVLNSYHKKQIGAALLRYRLERIFITGRVEAVNIETSQHAEGFFEKHGFATTSKSIDGYAPGLHKVHMKLTKDK